MDDGREVASAQPAGSAGKAPRDLRQEITDRMVAALGEGRIPWDRPWENLEHGLPRNVASGREYRGGNRLLLQLIQMDQAYADPRFGTVKQINELGGRVKKGEKGHPIEVWKEQPFWERRDVTVTAAYGHRVKVFGEERGAVLAGAYSDKEPSLRLNPDDLLVVHHPSGKPEQRMPWKDAHRLDVMVGRVFTVFNVEQTEGMTIEPLAKAEQRFDVVERGEAIKAAMGRDGLKFSEHPKFAFYSPKRDEVSVPPRGQFQDEKGYYGTLLHEIGHATGAEKRLNREGITGNHRFGSEGYAKEELRAEIFSVFMAAQTGIPHDETRHKAYIQSWAEALTQDKNEIFRAAAEAGKAVDYVLDKERGIEVERRAPERLTPVEVDAPAAWASALINNDYSGLDAQEVQTVKRWLQEQPGRDPVSVSETTRIGRFNGLQTEMATYTFLDRGTGKPQEHDIGDKTAPRVVSAAFVHKPGDGERLVEQLAGEKKTEQAKIIESRNLSTAEYDAFVGDLFADYGWLKGKGGIEPLPQGGQQRHVIELMAKDRQTLLVDPSGHGYARIVGIPEADIARVVESKSLAVPADPGKRPALAPEAALQAQRWHEKRAGDLAPGDRIMERIPGHAAFVDRVDDVRSIRDGKVHVDLNNDTATRVYAEDEKVTVIGESQEPPEKPEPERQAPARRGRRKSRGMER